MDDLDDLSDDECYTRLCQRGMEPVAAAAMVRARFGSAEGAAALAHALRR